MQVTVSLSLTFKWQRADGKAGLTRKTTNEKNVSVFDIEK